MSFWVPESSPRLVFQEVSCAYTGQDLNFCGSKPLVHRGQRVSTPLIPLLCSPGEAKRQAFPVFTDFSSMSKSVNNTSVVLSRSSLLRPQKASHAAHLPALSKKCFQFSSGVSAGLGHLSPPGNSSIFVYFFFLDATFFLSLVQVGHHWIAGSSAFNADEVCVTCTWLSVQTALSSSYSTSGIYGIAI